MDYVLFFDNRFPIYVLIDFSFLIDSLHVQYDGFYFWFRN